MKKIYCNFGEHDGESYVWIAYKKCSGEVEGNIIVSQKTKNVSGLQDWEHSPSAKKNPEAIRTSCASEDVSIEFYLKFLVTMFGVTTDRKIADNSIPFDELKERVLDQVEAYEEPSVPTISPIVFAMVEGCRISARDGRSRVRINVSNCHEDMCDSSQKLAKWLASFPIRARGCVTLPGLPEEWVDLRTIADQMKAYAKLLKDMEFPKISAVKAIAEHKAEKAVPVPTPKKAPAKSAEDKQRAKDQKMLAKLLAENVKLKSKK